MLESFIQEALPVQVVRCDKMTRSRESTDSVYSLLARYNDHQVVVVFQGYRDDMDFLEGPITRAKLLGQKLVFVTL